MDPQWKLKQGIKIYLGKDGATQDTKKELKLIKTSADKGHSKSQPAYALLLYNGEGVNQN